MCVRLCVEREKRDTHADNQTKSNESVVGWSLSLGSSLLAQPRFVVDPGDARLICKWKGRKVPRAPLAAAL